MKENLAGYKVPREVEFVDELPRNPAGKVLKRERRGSLSERPSATRSRRSASERWLARWAEQHGGVARTRARAPSA